MKPVGPAAWPCNPGLPSTWPKRNHDGKAGLSPTGGMPGQATFTPSADAPEEVASDDVPSEADDEGPVGDS